MTPDKRSAFVIDPNRLYMLSPDSHPLTPNDDIIGLNFSPGCVVLDNLRHYRSTKQLINAGTIPATAPIARDVVDVDSDEFAERLRTMVYDIEAGVTLEQTLGGKDKFDAVVVRARLKLHEEEQPPYDFWKDVCTPDSVYEPR